MVMSLTDSMGGSRFTVPPVSSPTGYSLTGGQANFMQPVAQTPQMMPTGGQPVGQLGPTLGGGGGGFSQINPLTGMTPTGLSGFENAMISGVDNALTAIRGMRNQAVRGIQGASGSGQASIRQGVNQANQFIDQGIAGFNPIAQQGTDASAIQAALSGAMGPEAQAQALQNLQPVNSFLQEQGERAVMRNAAALGGVGGGNVLKELTRFGQGLAGQSAQQQFANLGTIAERGFGALHNIGNLRGQQGQFSYQGGRDIADIGTMAANAAANARMQAGSQIGSIFGQAGRDIGQARLGTGQQIAGAIGSTTSALSNLMNQQGAGLSDMIGTGSSNIASLLAGLGAQDAASQEQLAAVLANLSTGQASQVASLPAIGNFVTPSNTMQNVSQLAGGIGTLLGAMNQGQTTQPAATINTGQQYSGFA